MLFTTLFLHIIQRDRIKGEQARRNTWRQFAQTVTLTITRKIKSTRRTRKLTSRFFVVNIRNRSIERAHRLRLFDEDRKNKYTFL